MNPQNRPYQLQRKTDSGILRKKIKVKINTSEGKTNKQTQRAWPLTSPDIEKRKRKIPTDFRTSTFNREVPKTSEYGARFHKSSVAIRGQCVSIYHRAISSTHFPGSGCSRGQPSWRRCNRGHQGKVETRSGQRCDAGDIRSKKWVQSFIIKVSSGRFLFNYPCFSNDAEVNCNFLCERDNVNDVYHYHLQYDYSVMLIWW